jgi:hypothetical protein
MAKAMCASIAKGTGYGGYRLTSELNGACMMGWDTVVGGCRIRVVGGGTVRRQTWPADVYTHRKLTVVQTWHFSGCICTMVLTSTRATSVTLLQVVATPYSARIARKASRRRPIAANELAKDSSHTKQAWAALALTHRPETPPRHLTLAPHTRKSHLSLALKPRTALANGLSIRRLASGQYPPWSCNPPWSYLGKELALALALANTIRTRYHASHSLSQTDLAFAGSQVASTLPGAVTLPGVTWERNSHSHSLRAPAKGPR